MGSSSTARQAAGTASLADARRVCVVGSSGAGKSWFSVRLSKRLPLPLVHLDVLHHRPGWEPMPSEQWHEVVKRLIRGSTWIIDGNYSGSAHIRFPASDHIVFFDYPRWLCMAGVLFRAAKWWAWQLLAGDGTRSRPDAPVGCRENLRLPFLRWVWTYPHHGRVRMIAKIREYGGAAVVVRVRSPGEARDLLSQVPDRAGRSQRG
jgi:adenylate kinase family enzyme